MHVIFVRGGLGGEREREIERERERVRESERAREGESERERERERGGVMALILFARLFLIVHTFGLMLKWRPPCALPCHKQTQQ